MTAWQWMENLWGSLEWALDQEVARCDYQFIISFHFFSRYQWSAVEQCLDFIGDVDYFIQSQRMWLDDFVDESFGTLYTSLPQATKVGSSCGVEVPFDFLVVSLCLFHQTGNLPVCSLEVAAIV